MRARIEKRVLKHFSPNFDILAGAFIGSRFSHPDVSSEESDFDCFLLKTVGFDIRITSSNIYCAGIIVEDGNRGC